MPSPDVQEHELQTKGENLPVTTDEGIELDLKHPEIQHFTPDTPATTVVADNAKYATFQMQVIMQLWDHATSFVRVTKLLREQREVLRFRGDNLGVPYGAKGNNNKGDDFTPLD